MVYIYEYVDINSPASFCENVLKKKCLKQLLCKGLPLLNLFNEFGKDFLGDPLFKVHLFNFLIQILNTKYLLFSWKRFFHDTFLEISFKFKNSFYKELYSQEFF